MKRSIFGLSLLLILITTSGAICKSRDTQPDALVLDYWTVFSDTEQLNQSILQFTATHPYITVRVRQLSPNEYEDELISSWLKGEGPDIYSLPNTHIAAFKDLIQPLQDTIDLTTVVTEKSLGTKETIITPQTLRTISVQQVSSSFPQVVYDDVVYDYRESDDAQARERVFGLPLSMDTLVLYYNKDMLSRVKIALPPVTWQDFVDQVPRLTLQDVDNNLIQSGAAFGTSNNVPRSMDIVSLLMMQNGATMTIGNRVAFAN